VVTAVGGGAVRDIALRRTPPCWAATRCIATCALAAAAVVVVLQLAGRPADGLVIGTAVGAVLCLLARWRGWILPEEITWRPLGRRRSKSPAG
jgi:uncharacterized membrane protein YeiH